MQAARKVLGEASAESPLSQRRARTDPEPSQRRARAKPAAPVEMTCTRAERRFDPHMGTPKHVRPAPAAASPVPGEHPPTLSYLFVEVTTACNLACLHCGAECRRGGEKKHLSVDAVLKVLRDIRRHHDPRGITVALTGGEPLCYPDLFHLGREITALEFCWGLVTNGYAWTPDKMRQAYGAGLHSISVSLDGLSDEHDWLRGKEGAFSKAIETISMLRRYPYWKAMDVVTCVHQRSLPTLDRLYLLLRALGVRDWRLYTLSPGRPAADHPELYLTKAQFREMIEKIKSFRAKNELHVNYSESGYLGPKVESQVRDYPYFCQAGIHVAGIMVDGDILACPNIDRRFKQGNIHTDSFSDVWENKYQEFRDRSWMKTGACATCGEWDRCQGNSFHLRDPETGRTRLCHCREYGLLNGDR